MPVSDLQVAQIRNWKREARQSYLWTLRIIHRLYENLTKGPIEITSPNTGSPHAEVFVRIHHTFMDKLWCWNDQLLDWIQSGFAIGGKPMWLKDAEWHELFVVKDSRYLDPNIFPFLDDNTRIIRGTGFIGLCEYDLEEAVRLWLKSKGLRAEIRFTSAPELEIA